MSARTEFTTPEAILGKMLYDMRVAAKKTQEEVAAELGLSGNPIVSDFETGESQIRLWHFVRACQIYGEDPIEVLASYLHAVPNPTPQKDTS